MATGTQKAVYFDYDVLEAIQKSDAKFSRRVNDLIRKGLRLEAKGDDIGVRGCIEGLIKFYNKNNKHPIIL